MKRSHSLLASCIRLIPFALPQYIAVLLQWAPVKLRLLPQIRCKKAVRVRDGDEGSLKGVFEGLGRAGRCGVDVLHTSKLEKAFDCGRCDETSTTGSRNELS